MSGHPRHIPTSRTIAPLPLALRSVLTLREDPSDAPTLLRDGLAGAPAGKTEPSTVAQVVGGTVTGPEQHTRWWMMHLKRERSPNDAEQHADTVREHQSEADYIDRTISVVMAKRADTLERERDVWKERYEREHGRRHEMEDVIEQARAEADRLREALRELEPYAERAEMRWMSVEDATIEIPARLVAELARRAALAGPQTKEQT